jgi:formylglycine-generating enzyme required for sulfatase activity
MLGNAWEFTEDCMLAQYATEDTKGAPVEGSCDKHVIRGGSWGRASKFLRSATRGGMNEAVRGVSNGIRLVREL